MASEWRHVPLATLMDVKHGFAFPGENIRDAPPGDILLTPGNFAIGGGFKGDKFKFYDGEVPEDYVLQEGDLIVTMTDLSKQSDTLGYPALVPRPQGHRFLHNQRLGKVLIKHDAGLDKRFLYYLLCTAEYRHEVLAGSTGTAIKHTSPGRILAYKAKIPPRATQEAIAAVLGALDDKIELNRRMSATLETMARALFKSWFVDFDPTLAKFDGRSPAGLDPATAALFPASFQDSSLGSIPQGWTAGTVGDAFHITMGQSPPGDTYNEAGQGLPFYQGKTDFGFRFPTRRVFCIAPTRYAKRDETLVSVRAPVGAINMAAEDCCIGRGLAAVHHKAGAASFTYYAMALLKSDFALFEAEGTVFGAINRQSFENLKFVVPPSEIVSAYERIAAPIDQHVRVLDDQSRTLATLRDALLPKLLSGELSPPAAMEMTT